MLVFGVEVPWPGHKDNLAWIIKLGIGITGLAAAAVFIRRCWVRLRHLPPGPWGVPFLGARLGPAWHLECMKMRAKYGDIQSFYIGNKLVVMLNSYDLIKEAFLVREHDFASRPPMNKEFHEYCGDDIFMIPYNEDQRKNKNFAVKAMKKVGMGHTTMEGKLLQEIQQVVKRLQAAEGEAADLNSVIIPALVRVTMFVFCNLDYEAGDPELEAFCGYIHALFETAIWIPPLLFHSLPRVVSSRLYPEYTKVWGKCDSLKNFFKAQIEEHRKTFDRDNIRDVIDIYLKEYNGPDLDVEKMARNVQILTPDSIDTIGSTLKLAFLYLAHYPEIQKKAQEEINRVVGNNQPGLSYRADLKYLEATILEVGRIMAVFPVGFAHAPSSDSNLGGYFIPKESYLFANFHSVHYDPGIFSKPETFDPELHFMNEKGDLINTEYVLNFSLDVVALGCHMLRCSFTCTWPPCCSSSRLPAVAQTVHWSLIYVEESLWLS